MTANSTQTFRQAYHEVARKVRFAYWEYCTSREGSCQSHDDWYRGCESWTRAMADYQVIVDIALEAVEVVEADAKMLEVAVAGAPQEED